MARIARILDGYYMNFDDHCLYSMEGRKVAELTRKTLEVLEYFCQHPDCYKRTEDINQYLEEGCLSSEAIRSRIHKLRASHDVFKAALTSNSSGYKYTGGRIENNGKIPVPTTRLNINNTIDSFKSVVNKCAGDYVKSIMSCSCKWGACSFDDIPQNTNTCEGALALLLSTKKEEYEDVLDDVMEYLFQECSESGLKSKSLDEDTVVPTSMFLVLCNKMNRYNEMRETIAKHLWEVRSNSGWGIYVRNMGKNTNIGCSYWALIGLSETSSIPEDEFQKYLRSMFRYEDSYKFGATIDDISSKIPSLYATSMMYILYNFLSTDSKKRIGNRYNSKKAIKYIIDNFDNPFFLIEQEGVNGTEASGKTSVHTVNWNHISINYSLTAIAVAIEKGELGEKEICEVLSRIIRIIQDNNEEKEELVFWAPPILNIDRGSRGKMVYPTMHLLMGLSKVGFAITKFG